MSTQPQPVVSYAPTRPLDVMPEVQQNARRGLSIVSIWPAELRAKRRQNGQVEYVIPAAPRGSYSKLVVFDTQQWIRRVFDAPGNEAREEILPAPLTAQQVAEDLVHTWAGDTLGARSGHRPGIKWILTEDPTPADMAELRTTQEALFNFFIVSANGFHLQGKGVEITDIHRMSAKYMLDKGAERLPWYMIQEFSDMKACPKCAQQIGALVLGCQHCGLDLPEWYEKWGIEPVGDKAVANFLETIRHARKAKAPDGRSAGQPKAAS